MDYRIAQISDTHLAAETAHLVPNFLLVAAAIGASKPDLIVNTGDISFDGVNCDADLGFAKSLHARLGLPTAVIPGNHDVGDDCSAADQPAIDERARVGFLRHFGPDFWMRDIPGWRLIGINAQLLGTDLDAARVQMDFVAAAVETSAGRRLALFNHKPLFDRSPSETDLTARFVRPGARAEILRAFADQPLALVASGHVHQYRSSSVEGVSHIWCPSTAFVFPAERQPTYGLRELGYVEHLLAANGSVESRFVRVDGLDSSMPAGLPT